MIAYDSVVPSTGVYGVYTMNSEGSNQVCISCTDSALPQNTNIGNPVWVPGGQYLVIQVQNPNYPNSSTTTPGQGINNNLWIVNADGSNARQLTNLPVNSGVLHAQVSHNGQTLTWAQKLVTKGWEIETAMLNAQAGTLSNIQTYRPGPDPNFYETSAFSLNDDSIYFAANLSGQPVSQINVYLMNLSNQSYIDTSENTTAWNEHGHLSPNGDKLIYASSNGVTQFSHDPQTYTDNDYYIANPDGSDPQRITFFNEILAPEYIAWPTAGVIAGDNDWSPDGTQFVGWVSYPAEDARVGAIVIVTLVLSPPSVSFIGSSASGTSPIAAGQLVSIYGSQLGPTLGFGLQLGPGGVVTNSNSGTQVLFDGVAAPIVFTIATQVNAVVPCSVAGKSSTQVVVEYMGAQSAAFTAALSPAAPGIFTADGSGKGQAAALNQDNSLNSPSNPAQRGSILTFFATGVGATSPCVDGQVYQGTFPTISLPVVVGVGGIGTHIDYSGQAPDLVSGVAQFDIVIPTDATTGVVPLTLEVGGISSMAGVTIAVQ